MRTIARLLLLLIAAAGAEANQVLVVANQGSHEIVLIEPESMQVIKRFPTALGPHEVAISGDRRRAYVSIYGAQAPGNQLAVIDVHSKSEIERIDLGPLFRPHGVVQRDGKIYFTAEASQSVGRYDPGSRMVDWVAPVNAVGSHMLAVGPDGTRVYTANVVSDSVSMIPLEGEPVNISVGDNPEGIAITPDGREVWSSARNPSGGVYIIDTATNTAAPPILTDVRSARVTITPDGTRALLFNLGPARDIVVVDVATRTVLRRIAMPDGGLPIRAIVTDDSKTAFVLMYSPDRVLKLDLETYEFRGSVAAGVAPDGLGLLDDSPAPARRRAVSVRP